MRTVGGGALETVSHIKGKTTPRVKQLFQRGCCEPGLSIDVATGPAMAESVCTCWMARFGDGLFARRNGTAKTVESVRTRLGFRRRLLRGSAVLVVLESVLLRWEKDEMQARIGSWSGVRMLRQQSRPSPFSKFRGNAGKADAKSWLRGHVKGCTGQMDFKSPIITAQYEVPQFG